MKNQNYKKSLGKYTCVKRELIENYEKQLEQLKKINASFIRTIGMQHKKILRLEDKLKK